MPIGPHEMEGTAEADEIRVADLLAFAWQPAPGESATRWDEVGHAVWAEPSTAEGRVVFEGLSADAAFTADPDSFAFRFTSWVEFDREDLREGGPWSWDPAAGVLDPQGAGYRDPEVSNLILTADWAREERYNDPIMLLVSGTREDGRWVLQEAPVPARVEAGDGDDTVLGGGGADRIYGGSGADLLQGGDGRDTIDGQLGDDLIQGGEGRDVASGGSGNDTLEGGAGNDTLYGFVGDDLLIGGEERDVMLGGTGNDTLVGGADSRDELSGGDGDDVLWGDEAGDTADDTPGREGPGDMVNGGAGNDLVGLGAGDDYAFGGTGADTIYGGLGNDQLVGFEGDDLLFGGDGNDLLQGGASVLGDTLTGGDGADRFYFVGEQQSPAVITDFDVAEGDLLGLPPFDGMGADEVTLEATAGGVEVLVLGDAIALLQGVTLEELEGADWLFT
jgi:hypothetical protein